MTKTDETLKLAKECGATTYTNRHYPEAAAVTFSPLAWEKFCEQAFAAPEQERELAGFAMKDGIPVSAVFSEGSHAVSVDGFTWTAQLPAAPVQKRPPNCGTSYCSCIECIMPPARPAPVKVWEAEGYDALMQEMQMVKARNIRQHAEIERLKAAQPAVPDAITDSGENPDYRAGWNECRETMLQILKARTL
jgi:hypothetical protein